MLPDELECFVSTFKESKEMSLKNNEKYFNQFEEEYSKFLESIFHQINQ
jgi:hypothetical protein